MKLTLINEPGIRIRLRLTVDLRSNSSYFNLVLQSESISAIHLDLTTVNTRILSLQVIQIHGTTNIKLSMLQTNKEDLSTKPFKLYFHFSIANP
jgi:hypothetical protein